METEGEETALSSSSVGCLVHHGGDTHSEAQAQPPKPDRNLPLGPHASFRRRGLDPLRRNGSGHDEILIQPNTYPSSSITLRHRRQRDSTGAFSFFFLFFTQTGACIVAKPCRKFSKILQPVIYEADKKPSTD